MTNVEALKNMYLVLGGSAEDLKGIDSNAAVINLLTAALGGSIGVLIVNGTLNEGAVTLDKTFAQINDAFGAGKNVIIKFTVDADGTVSYQYGVTAVIEEESAFKIKVSDALTFTAQSRDGYPVSES